MIILAINFSKHKNVKRKEKTYIICLLFGFVLNETLGKMYIILILVPEAFM